MVVQQKLDIVVLDRWLCSGHMTLSYTRHMIVSELYSVISNFSRNMGIIGTAGIPAQEVWAVDRNRQFMLVAVSWSMRLYVYMYVLLL